jgi:hypothetical protein
MPIEIREMVIKALVKLGNEVDEMQSSSEPASASIDVVQQGMEQISMMIKQENER